MVYYPIQTLMNAGITEVLIVTGDVHAGDFINVIKNGRDLGLSHVEYAYQEGGSGGISDALKYAEDFADGESVAVILGDNTTDADISSAVSGFSEGAMVFLKEVTDPNRFGIPRFSESDPSVIEEILEKPEVAPCNLAVTGLYLYDNTVFDKIRTLKPSGRGELEVTDLNNAYIKEGKLKWATLEGFWSDAGTFESLFRTNAYWAKKVLG
jgi:glucose-1-phosphate thymidylyltransferase